MCRRQSMSPSTRLKQNGLREASRNANFRRVVMRKLLPTWPTITACSTPNTVDEDYRTLDRSTPDTETRQGATSHDFHIVSGLSPRLAFREPSVFLSLLRGIVSSVRPPSSKPSHLPAHPPTYPPKHPPSPPLGCPSQKVPWLRSST